MYNVIVKAKYGSEWSDACSVVESNLEAFNLRLTGPNSKHIVRIFREAVLSIGRLSCLDVYCKDVESNQGLQSTLAGNCYSWKELNGRIFEKVRFVPRRVAKLLMLISFGNIRRLFTPIATGSHDSFTEPHQHQE